MRAAPRSPSPQHFYAPRQYSAPVALSSSYQTPTSTSTSNIGTTSGRALSTFFFSFFFFERKDRSREVRALREQHRVPKPPCFECGEELKRERRKKGGGRKFVFFFFFFFSRRAQDAPGLVSEASIGVNTLQMRFMQKNPKTRFVLNSCFRCDAN